MKKDFYQEIIKKANFGYAHHEIMLDEHGKPIDYRYLDVNQAFRDLTGIKDKYIVGKTVTGLIPGIRSEKLDWVNFYGKIALEGGEENFEQYAEHLGIWYRVHAYSNEKFFFTTIFTDISQKKALQHYRKHLKMAQSFTGTGSWEYDINTGVLLWSAECEKLFGLEEGSFEGTFEDFLSRVHPEDRDYVARVNKPITELKEGVPLQYDHRVIKKDGTVIWVRETAGVVDDTDGKPAMIVGFVHDITEQKDIAAALEQEEKLRQIVNNIDGAFWLMSADMRETLYLSPNFENIVGIPVEQIQGKLDAFIDAIHEEDREGVVKKYQEFLSTGKYDQEYRIRRPDGGLRWVHANGFPVKDEQGQVIRYAGFIQDITENKTAEIVSKRLQRSYKDELDFRKFLFQGNRDGLVILNNDHKVVDSNQAFCKMLGYTPEELKSLHTWDFDALTTEEEVKDAFDTTIDVDYTFESQHRRKDGSVYDVEISARSFQWRGERLVVCTCRDISERKQAEKELKEYEERTNQLLRQTRTTLFELDPDGLYIYLSPSVQEMTGYTVDELAEKKHFYDIVPEQYRDAVKESALKQMRQQLKFSGLISPLEKKDGTALWIETSRCQY